MISPRAAGCKRCRDRRGLIRRRGERIGEEGMQRGDDLRTFAHRGGDALHRARAHVADGEDSMTAGFQRLAVGAGQVATGEHEAFTIKLHARVPKPGGIRVGADEQEQVLDGAVLLAPLMPPADRLEPAVLAFEPCDLGVGQHPPRWGDF